MSEEERRHREVLRRLDAIAALSAYAALAASYRPKRKSIGDRLWDLL